VPDATPQTASANASSSTPGASDQSRCGAHAPEQRRADPAAERRGLDGEDAELRLVRPGDLAERPAVGHKRHRAEHPAAGGGDQQLRVGGARHRTCGPR
jgi:hypothetical protein